MKDISRFVSRKPTRLTEFDYSSVRYYFITICTNEKRCIFGTTQELSTMGKVAEQEMLSLDSYYSGVHVDHFVIMPNHVHAIISIEHSVGITGKTTLSSIVGSYKSGVSRKIRMVAPEITIWQRSFHDHIIRGKADYEKIWNYIQYNPLKWEDDCFYIPN